MTWRTEGDPSMTRVRKLRRLAAALSIAGLGAAGAAGAAQLTVNSAGDDTTAADGLVTLREAIAAAEADAATDLGETGSGDDVIVFDPALTAGGDATITLGAVGDTRFGPAAFGITTTLTIRGAAGENGILLLRSGAIPSLRHFNVADTGDLTLENLQLAAGRAKGGDGGTNLGDDGGGGGGGAGLGGGGAAAGGAGRGATAGGAGFGLGLPSGPRSSLACATTIGAVCACDAGAANCMAVRAVVASSTRRSCVMMVWIPGMIGNRM
jgi:hypothetical protein